MLKLKKNVKKKLKLGIIVIILLVISCYTGLNIYIKKQYEKTYEYKLISIGYNLEDAKLIDKEYKDKEKNYILKNEYNSLYLEILNNTYFIYDNFYEYINLINGDSRNIYSLRDIIEKVNTKTNKVYYTDTIKSDISKNDKILVNKYYYLDSDYEPGNLVTISQDYSWGNLGSQKCIEYVYEAFKEMWKSAKEEGYYLMISSSYRSYDDQEKVYNNYKEAKGTEYADSIAARPGYSEHQTGLSLDIFEKKNSSQKTFHETEVYNWLKENSYKYGFILRYPENKENITGYSFESWHYRYVGKDIAKYIYDNNITYDEYYAYYLN